jgi:hypothetical protein
MLRARHGLIALLAFAFGLVMPALAQSASVSAGGETVMFNVSSKSGGFDWTIVSSGSASTGNHSYVYVQNVSGNGVTSGGMTIEYSSYNSGSGTFTGSRNYVGWLYVILRIRSNGAVATIAETTRWIQVGAAEQWKVTVSLQNTRDRPVTYRLMQGGNAVGEVTLQPGEGLIQTFTVPEGTEVTVLERVTGLELQGETWVAVDGAVTTKQVGTVTPTNVPSGGTNPDPVPVQPSPEIPTNTQTTATAARPVWRSSGTSMPEDLLTNTVYREGIEKIKEDTSKLAGAIPKDDQATLDQKKSAVTAAVNTQRTTMETTANSEFTQKVGQNPVLAETATGNLGVSGSDGWPSVTIPLLGTVSFNPYNLPWLIGILRGCREIILILLCVAFVRLQFERANAYELQVMTVNAPVTTQTVVENAAPIGGQLLAWFKTAVTALVVVQVVIAAYAAAIFFLDTQLGEIASVTWRALVGGAAMVQTKLGSAAGNVFWTLAQEFFPLDAFLRLLLADVVCLFSMGKIFLLASAVVKAIRA